MPFEVSFKIISVLNVCLFHASAHCNLLIPFGCQVHNCVYNVFSYLLIVVTNGLMKHEGFHMKHQGRFVSGPPKSSDLSCSHLSEGPRQEVICKEEESQKFSFLSFSSVYPQWEWAPYFTVSRTKH